MDWDTLDLYASDYWKMFYDQKGSCPNPMLTAESFTLTWESYEDSSYNYFGADATELE